MARNWMKSEQRSYRAKRKKQAQLVADRLLGKKPKISIPDPLDDRMDALTYNLRMMHKFQMNNPRHSFIITGMEGV